MQGFHASAWIEGGLLTKPAINHKEDVLDGDGCFGYVGGDDDFAGSLGGRFKDLDLLLTG